MSNRDVASNIWHDTSGHGNHFAMVGVVYNSSDVGGSIALQGTTTSYLQDIASYTSGLNTPLKPDTYLHDFTGEF